MVELKNTKNVGIHPSPKGKGFLPIEVKRIIVHGKCADGMASAIILYDALKIEPEFIIHGSQEYDDLEATEGMLFCDISPPEHRYEDFVKVGAVVLDHHRGSQAIVEAFGENGVFADEDKDPGISGAFLAFREVWQQMFQLPQFGADHTEYNIMVTLALLAGIYDTWQHNHPDWGLAGAQVCALTFYSWDYWKKKLDNKVYDFSNELRVGQMIYNDRASKVVKLAESVINFECSGYNVAVFNDPDHFTSEVAEALRVKGINVIAGFRYSKKNVYDNKPLILFSIRTDGSIDASDLAKTIPGGGGHTKAAGFAEVIDLTELNAFAAFKEIFEVYIKYYK
jgi:hypothetical protein